MTTYGTENKCVLPTVRAPSGAVSGVCTEQANLPSPLDAHGTLLATRALPVFLCGAAATISRVG